MNFQDFITTELPLRPFVSTDGLAGQTLVRSTNPLAPREMVWADVGTGQSAYDLAVSLGFQGTESEWISSLKGEKGDPGLNSIASQTPIITIDPMNFGVIDSISVSQYGQIVWDIYMKSSTKVRRGSISAIIMPSQSVQFNMYGVLGDKLNMEYSVTYDTLSDTIKLIGLNNSTAAIRVTTNRYPITNF